MHGTITVHVYNESDDGEDDENIIYMTRRALCNQTSLTFHLIFHDEFKRYTKREETEKNKNVRVRRVQMQSSNERYMCLVCTQSSHTAHWNAPQCVWKLQAIIRNQRTEQ